MNRLKILTFAGFALIVLGCSDTARADVVLNVTPQTLTFTNVSSNSVSAAQIVQVSANQAATVIVQTNQASPWLAVSNGPINIGSVATNLNVKVNTTNLQQGAYNGSFTISVSGQPQNQITVNVTLTVNGQSLLTATPPSVAFSALQGATSGVPGSTCAGLTAQAATCTVQIASSGAALQYTLQAQTQNGVNWLLLSSTAGATGDAGFNVSVNPSTLAVGTYAGSITATSTTTGDSVQLPVTLTVNPNAMLTVTPATVPPFLYQIGGTAPLAQALTVSTSAGTVPFSVRVSPAASWLVVSPLSGSAGTSPAQITLSVSPGGLPAASYSTNVIVTQTGGGDLPAVPVTLVVSANPLLQISKTALSYTAQFSSAQSPPDQQVTVTSSGAGTVGFGVSSDSSWLTASSSASTTPATVTVHVNPSALTVGNYTGNITVKPSNGDQYSETIAVSLAVTNTSQLVAAPADLLFSFQTGQAAPAPQTVQVQSVGQPVAFTIATATSTCGSNWLTAASNSTTTPATLTVSVVTTGMIPGACSGTITLNYNSGSGPASVPILVTLAVSNASELVVSVPPGFGTETVQQGSGAFTRLIALTSTDLNTPVTFNATATSNGGTWLLAGAGTNLTPQNLVVQFLPGALTAGQYTGTITISSSSLGTAVLTIPVILNVTSNTAVTVAPTSVTFTEAQGGPVPAAQNLTLTSTGGTATFTATIPSVLGGSNWLKISPTSGTATGTIQVSVLPNSLTQGDYTAQIVLAFQGAATAPITIPVTLHVTPPQTVSVAPSTALSFAYQIGGAQPAAQKITVSSTGGAVAFTVGTSSSGWLSVDSTTGTTPKDINASVNTQGLQAGSYSGSISISAPGVLANPITINVSLTVTAPTPPAPVRIFNAASGAAGVIAPGEIITITGTQLGPVTPASGVSFAINAKGGLDPLLSGVRVLFDNNPGTPIFVSATQINVVVPYEIAGRVTTNVVVEYNGVQSAPFQLRLADTAPALFTNNFSGTGQVAAINQNGTYNGVQGNGFTPAPQDTEIQLYGTGGGQTGPASVTGSVTPVPTSPAGLLKVPGVLSATVGGVPATVDFAGAAPGLITGAIQFNVHIPKGVTGNNVPITISINGVASPLGTTIAVQ